MDNTAFLQLTENFLAELGARGISARWEYPGAVSIEVSPTENIWTGLNGWDYGTVNVLVDGEWQPDESAVAEIDANVWAFSEDDLIDPVFLAMAWARIVHARQTLARVEDVATEAAGAFWTVVARSFPEATTGDLDPATAEDVRQHMVYAVRAWVESNAI